MKHPEFVKAYEAQKIDVLVHKSLAGHFFENPYLLPQHYRKQQAHLRLLAFCTTIGGIVLFFFIEWYFALIVLFIGLVLFPVCQNHAAKIVLQIALERPGFFDHCIENGIIKIVMK